MDKTIIVAFIGLVGVILTVLFNTFEDELKDRIFGRAKENRDLIGKWKCTWLLDGEIKEKRLPSDIVEISKVSGGKIVANGENVKYGGYKLTGRISPAYLVTLIYQGTDKHDHSLGGVAILELNPRRDEMRGYWHEYDADRTFYGGKTVWRKVE